MSVESNTSDYSSHKYKRNVFVSLNSKTKLGQDLLRQYHENSENHYMDIGRIGYHDSNRKYVINQMTVMELIAVPKIIIRVFERAVNRGGRDVYELRTYMSKFGQLNFLLTVENGRADLILIENVYIENLNHRENYETVLYSYTFNPNQAVPLREVFYKFGIRANPDDYGKSWKEENISINNLIVAKATSEMTKQYANLLGAKASGKALVSSLNYLNKEGSFGKKITNSYSKVVSSSAGISKLANSPKLENTLNHVLLKTMEKETTKNDLKKFSNFAVYKKVLDIQFSVQNAVSNAVEKINTKENLKNFLLGAYQSKALFSMKDEREVFDKNQLEFENIVGNRIKRKTLREKFDTIQEKISSKTITPNILTKTYKNFENQDVNVDFNLSRFKKEQTPAELKAEKRLEKLRQKEEKKRLKEEKRKSRGMKKMKALCDLDEELEKSKTYVGVKNEKDKKKKKIFEVLNKKEKKTKNKEQDKQTNIIKKLEQKIKNQEIKREEKKKQKSDLKSKRQKEKELKKDKKRLFKEYAFKNKAEKKDNTESKDKKKKNLMLDEKQKQKETKKSLQKQIKQEEKERRARKKEEKKTKINEAKIERKNLKGKTPNHVKLTKKMDAQQNPNSFRPIVKEAPKVEKNPVVQPKVEEKPKVQTSPTSTKSEVIKNITKLKAEERKYNVGTGMYTNKNTKERTLDL